MRFLKTPWVSLLFLSVISGPLATLVSLSPCLAQDESNSAPQRPLVELDWDRLKEEDPDAYFLALEQLLVLEASYLTLAGNLSLNYLLTHSVRNPDHNAVLIRALKEDLKPKDGIMKAVTSSAFSSGASVETLILLSTQSDAREYYENTTHPREDQFQRGSTAGTFSGSGGGLALLGLIQTWESERAGSALKIKQRRSLGRSSLSLAVGSSFVGSSVQNSGRVHYLVLEDQISHEDELSSFQKNLRSERTRLLLKEIFPQISESDLSWKLDEIENSDNRTDRLQVFFSQGDQSLKQFGEALQRVQSLQTVYLEQVASKSSDVTLSVALRDPNVLPVDLETYLTLLVGELRQMVQHLNPVQELDPNLNLGKIEQSLLSAYQQDTRKVEAFDGRVRRFLEDVKGF